ncbi:leucyl aminopeptidase [Actinomyces israelii]
MTTLEMIPSSPARNEVEALVLAAADTDKTPALVTDGASTEGLDLQALAAALPAVGFTGALDAVVRLPADVLGPDAAADCVLVVGTGPGLDAGSGDAAALGAARPGVLRRAAGCAARELAGVGSAAFLLPADSPDDLRAVAEGALVGAYAWSGRVPAPTAPLERVVVATPLAGSEEAGTARARATALAESTALVRDLVNEPPNRLTPKVLAERARALADDAGLDVEVLDETLLRRRGFGGIVGVGQGSAHPPFLVRVSWVPERPAQRVALIGKGITFDSGGLSLKPAASMPEMKSDMAGAATALGAVTAAARLRLGVRVDAWLALAENMPAADAQRPSDIVTMYNGTTVEVTNTDAEGRLVMADALARAVEDRPDCVLDVATLTGAQIIALGDRVSGVMGTPSVRDEVAACAAGAGEAFWPMPLPEHLRAALESPFAALRNTDMSSRAGGMLVAGLFLREFVGDVPWAHLDIAGPAYNEKSAWGATPVGGTGAGLATLVALLSGRA